MKTEVLVKLAAEITQGSWRVPGQPDKVCAEGYTKQGHAKVIANCEHRAWMGPLEAAANAEAIGLVPDLLAEVIALRALTAQGEAEPVAGAPERIWAWEGDGQDGWENAYATTTCVAVEQVEYIRADLAHPATPVPVEAGLLDGLLATWSGLVESAEADFAEDAAEAETTRERPTSGHTSLRSALTILAI